MEGIEVTCFDAADMGTAAPPAGEQQMIVTLQHGWRGYEVRDFLLQREEVMLVEWDSVKTVPPRLLPAGGPRQKRKGRKAAAPGRAREEL